MNAELIGLLTNFGLPALFLILAATSAGAPFPDSLLLIEACVDHGMDTEPRIIGALACLGYNPALIGQMLAAHAGSDPTRHRWRVTLDERVQLLTLRKR